MSSDLTEQLTDYISRELLMRGAGDPVAPDDELLFSGLLDSIAVMRLVGFIESDLHRQIPPQDVTLANFSSVSALTAYLRAQSDVSE